MSEIIEDELRAPTLAYIDKLHKRIEALEVELQITIKALEESTARIEALEAALRNARAAIMEADPAVLCCTLWMPNHISPAETVVDHIDAALAPENGGVK